MKIERFAPDQRFFRAEIFCNGHDVDNGTGDAFTTRAEAEADGEEMAAAHDPEWQKRHPGQVESSAREWVVDSADEDGALGSAHTV